MKTRWMLALFLVAGGCSSPPGHGLVAMTKVSFIFSFTQGLALCIQPVIATLAEKYQLDS